jgi:hypothetical protein
LIKGFGIAKSNGIINFKIALDFFRPSTKLMVPFGSSTRKLWVKLYKISLFYQNILSLSEKFDFTFFESWWFHLISRPRKPLVKLNKISSLLGSSDNTHPPSLSPFLFSRVLLLFFLSLSVCPSSLFLSSLSHVVVRWFS